MLKITVRQQGDIKEDYEKFERRLDRAIYGGLKVVASELPYALRKHIDEDYYAQYAPITGYERRYMIGDDSAMNTTLTRNSITFEYHPVGANSRNLVGGDRFLSIMETATGYGWEFANVPPRPFWQKFATEQLEGGEMERNFVKGMNETDSDLQVVTTSEIIKDGSDTD